ncbi:MAG: AraC family transcriptional regulator [Muribaculaceae bacterium]|nr:AraC family transcriptional regulator [Muribaculaceae bacterium]
MKLRDGFSGQRSIVLPKMILDVMMADPVLSALHITAIGYYPDAGYHFRERPEPIGEYVFIYCTAGEGWFEVEGVRNEVATNSYFILPAGIPHSYGAKEQNPWTIYWIHFSGTLARHYAADCAMPHLINPGIGSRIRNRTNLFEEIFSTLDSGFSIEGIRYAMSLFHHYLGTLRYLREYRSAGEKSGDRDIIDATIHFMNENIERTITLSQLSSYSGYSQSYLSSVFKERTGHSPLAYFNLLKVRHACQLLDSTDMKLNCICHMVGISDPYYFSRLFSKVMGMSPSSYRKRPDI